MDGNGRWAKARGLPRQAGHREGVKAIRDVIKGCQEIGISYLTVFAFSTENWNRSEEEISYLLSLPLEFISRYRSDLEEENVRMRWMGRRQGLPAQTLDALQSMEDITADKQGLQVVFAFNYGGKSEIVDACINVAREVSRGLLAYSQIDLESVQNHLYMPGVPEADLVIRTSGEKRLSNFLLWQAAYAELYFTDILWPDFNSEALQDAINDFSNRQRRFGRV